MPTSVQPSRPHTALMRESGNFLHLDNTSQHPQDDARQVAIGEWWAVAAASPASPTRSPAGAFSASLSPVHQLSRSNSRVPTIPHHPNAYRLRDKKKNQTRTRSLDPPRRSPAQAGGRASLGLFAPPLLLTETAEQQGCTAAGFWRHRRGLCPCGARCSFEARFLGGERWLEVARAYLKVGLVRGLKPDRLVPAVGLLRVARAERDLPHTGIGESGKRRREMCFCHGVAHWLVYYSKRSAASRGTITASEPAPLTFKHPPIIARSRD